MGKEHEEHREHEEHGIDDLIGDILTSGYVIAPKYR
jgi:hypothetical protein